MDPMNISEKIFVKGGAETEAHAYIMMQKILVPNYLTIFLADMFLFDTNKIIINC